jgi:hypothetical protein
MVSTAQSGEKIACETNIDFLHQNIGTRSAFSIFEPVKPPDLARKLDPMTMTQGSR